MDCLAFGKSVTAKKARRRTHGAGFDVSQTHRRTGSIVAVAVAVLVAAIAAAAAPFTSAPSAFAASSTASTFAAASSAAPTSASSVAAAAAAISTTAASAAVATIPVASAAVAVDSVFERDVAPFLPFTFRQKDLAGEFDAVLIVDSDHLDLDRIADIDDVGHRLDETVGEFTDVQQAVLAGSDLNKGTEVLDRDDLAGVDAADLDVLGHRLHMGQRGVRLLQ